MTHHASRGASRSEWRTPAWVIELVCDVIGGPIALDPASSADNPTRAQLFYTPAEDGLRMPWAAASVFLNPPWSRRQGLTATPWLKRAYEVAQGAGLWTDFHMFVVTGASVNAKWWHQYVAPAPRHFFPLGRIHYDHPSLDEPENPSFDSAIAYFGSAPDRFELHFAPYGKVLR